MGAVASAVGGGASTTATGACSATEGACSAASAACSGGTPPVAASFIDAFAASPGMFVARAWALAGSSSAANMNETASQRAREPLGRARAEGLLAISTMFSSQDTSLRPHHSRALSSYGMVTGQGGSVRGGRDLRVGLGSEFGWTGRVAAAQTKGTLAMSPSRWATGEGRPSSQLGDLTIFPTQDRAANGQAEAEDRNRNSDWPAAARSIGSRV